MSSIDEAKLRSGDESEWIKLDERFRVRLLALAKLRLSELEHRVDKEDVVQSVFRRLHANLLKRDEPISDLSALVLASLNKACVDKLRLHHRQIRDVNREQRLATSGPNKTIDPNAIEPVNDAIAQEGLERLAEELAALTDLERRVVRLKSEGLTFYEIGADVGCTAEAVRKRYHRVLAKLRDELAESTRG